MTYYIKTLIKILESFTVYIRPSFGIRSLQFKYRIPGKHFLYKPNMTVSQMTVCLLIVIVLSKAVLSFCPQGFDCRHRDNGRMHLQCEKSNLTTFTITNRTNTDIDSIHLGGNYLKSFHGTEVSSFSPNLSMLDLKENQLEKVENDTFRGFLQLELLDISYNNITENDSYGFSDLRKLKTLQSRNNKINIVQNSWFKNLEEVKMIDLRHNLIQTFEPLDFRWPSNLKTLLLQGNSFHVLPLLPRLPDLVDLSDNEIDCSCQRLGQEKVDKEVLLKVTVTCTKMSSEKWRKQHWEKPNCTFPMVHVYCKEFDDIYIIKCTGDGFPPPKVSFKHEGHVIATSVQNQQVIYGLTNYTNVTCEVSNAVEINESTINRTGPLKEVRINQQEVMDQDIPNPRLSTFSIVSYTVMLVLCSFSAIALIVSLYMFNLFFRQFHYTYETYVSI